VDLQSTAADIVITAPEKIVLNGGGGYVKIEGGNIEIGTSGAASFKASMKELGGGGSGSGSGPALKQAQGLFNEAFVVKDEETGEVMRHVRYRIEDANGKVQAQGMTDDMGRTARVHTSKQVALKLFLLD
jgi:type VI secretion system secreted protein VgrG